MKKLTLLLFSISMIFGITIISFGETFTEYFIKNEYAVGDNSAASDFDQNYIWKKVENVEYCKKIDTNTYEIKYKLIHEEYSSNKKEEMITVITGADNIMIIKTETVD